MAFCYPRTKQTDLGHLLLISQAKAFLTDSKKPLRFSSLAAESGRKWMFVLRVGQCHGAQEGGSLKDSHAAIFPHRSASWSVPDLPLHHVRQLLSDGPVWVDLNGVIVVKERAELRQTTRREVTSAPPTGPQVRSKPLQDGASSKSFLQVFTWDTSL